MALVLRSRVEARSLPGGQTVKALTFAAALAGSAACAAPARVEVQRPTRSAPRLVAAPSSDVASAAQAPSVELHTDRFVALKAPDTPRHCTWASADWRLARDVELRFRPGGAPFARTTAARATARVVVSGGPSGPTAFVEISSDDVRLRGYMDRDAFDLHATTPLAVAGMFAPEGRANLTLVSSSAGQVEIQLAIPERVHPRRGVSARARVSCEQVGLDVTRFSTRPAFAGDDTRGVLLPNQAKLQLYDGPSGTPLARIDQDDGSNGASEGEHRALELDRVGGWSRVALDVEDVMVVGWLRSSLLNPVYTGGLVGFGSGRRYHKAELQPALRTLACGPEIPLLARAKPASPPRRPGGATATSTSEDEDLAYQRVGEIKTGVPFDVLSDGEEVSEVQLKGSQTQALGRFAVPTRTIAGCREVFPKAEDGSKGGK